jgi:hypothetical protein
MMMLGEANDKKVLRFISFSLSRMKLNVYSDQLQNMPDQDEQDGLA